MRRRAVTMCCCWSRATSAKARPVAALSWHTAACATWSRAISGWSWKRSRSGVCFCRTRPTSCTISRSWCQTTTGGRPHSTVGLKLYELLAGKYGFGTSRILSREETLEHLPTLKTEGLRGGAIYYDGQFDDARLLIHMAVTAFEQGATLLNYVEVTGLTKDAQGFVDGVSARDVETGNEFRAAARVVVN